MKKVGIFVDVSNLYFSLKRRYNNRRLDYRKFKDYVSDFGDITLAKAYGYQLNGQASKFINALQAIGYEAIYKDVKQIQTDSGRFRKGDWDVGIAVDIIRHYKELDLIVLACADGDLAPLVTYLQDADKQVVVIASGISHELKDLGIPCIEIPASLLEKEYRRANAQDADA